jgi:predicted RNA-binding Zn-ribbon protein involved in translation (DUF1610 family)
VLELVGYYESIKRDNQGVFILNTHNKRVIYVCVACGNASVLRVKASLKRAIIYVNNYISRAFGKEITIAYNSLPTELSGFHVKKSGYSIETQCIVTTSRHQYETLNK